MTVMPRQASAIALKLLLLGFAGILSAMPQDGVEIGIVTYGPGTAMASRFGHTAIVLLQSNGEKEFYELAAGLPQGGVLPWYLAPGRPLEYVAQAVRRTDALTKYVVQDRSIDIRMLNLGPAAKTRFAQLLAQAIAEDQAKFTMGAVTSSGELIDRKYMAENVAQPSRMPDTSNTSRYPRYT